MAGATAAFPGALWLMETANPARGRSPLRVALKLSTVLGLAGGFLYAYQRSSCMLFACPCHTNHSPLRAGPRTTVSRRLRRKRLRQVLFRALARASCRRKCRVLRSGTATSHSLTLVRRPSLSYTDTSAAALVQLGEPQVPRQHGLDRVDTYLGTTTAAQRLLWQIRHCLDQTAVPTQRQHALHRSAASRQAPCPCGNVPCPMTCGF